MKAIHYQYRDSHLCDYGYRRKVVSHRAARFMVDTHALPRKHRLAAEAAGTATTFVRLQFGLNSLCEITPAEAREIALRLIETAKACEDARAESTGGGAA